MNRTRIIMVAVAGLVAVRMTMAAQWVGDTGGNWTDDGNWNAAHPNASGAVADFSAVDLTTDRTVTLDASRMIGSLMLGDAGTAPHGGWLFSTTGSVLTFNASGDSTLTINQGDRHVLDVPISLAKGLVVTTASGTKVTLSGNITGNQWVQKKGTGTLVLSGSNTHGAASYSINTEDNSNAGTIVLQHAGALGASAFRVAYGGTITLDNQTGGTFAMTNNLITGGGAQHVKFTGGDFELTGTNLLQNDQGRIYSLDTAHTVTIRGTVASRIFLYGPGPIEVKASAMTGAGGIHTITEDTSNQPARVGMGGSFGNIAKTILRAQYGLYLYAIDGPQTITNQVDIAGYGYNSLYFIGTNAITFSGPLKDAADGFNRGHLLHVTNALAVTVSGTVTGVRGATQNYYRKSGDGLLVFSGANTYDFRTEIHGGALRAADGEGLPTNSFLLLQGGVLETSGTFNRALAAQPATSDDGTGKFRWNGSGGFSAHGGALAVNVNGGGPDNLTWDTGNFVPGGQALILGSPFADNVVTFTDHLDLNNAARTVQVNDNPESEGDMAVISGNINGTGSSALVKTGGGILLLDGVGTYTGATTVAAGYLGGDGSLAGDLVVAAAGGVAAQAGRSLHVAGDIDLSATGTRIKWIGDAPAARTVILTYAGSRSGTFSVEDLTEGARVDYNTSGQIAIRSSPAGTVLSFR